MMMMQPDDAAPAAWLTNYKDEDSLKRVACRSIYIFLEYIKYSGSTLYFSS